MAEKKYVRARSGFLTADRTIVKAGQIVAATDEVVQGRETLFEPMEDHVEAATRAPGEKRLTVKRPDAVVLSAAPAKRGRRGKTADKPPAQKPPAAPTGDGGGGDAGGNDPAAQGGSAGAENPADGSTDPGQGGSTPDSGD